MAREWTGSLGPLEAGFGLRKAAHGLPRRHNPPSRISALIRAPFGPLVQLSLSPCEVRAADLVLIYIAEFKTHGPSPKLDHILYCLIRTASRRHTGPH